MLWYIDLMCSIWKPEEATVKVTKVRIENDPVLNISLLKISNINTLHKSKMVWNKRYNLQTKLVQFTDQKEVWVIDKNSTNRTFHK